MIALGAALALAHGQLDEQIELCTRLIQASPANPRHRLRRGELYRLHGENHTADAAAAARDWASAEEDFARALELDPGLRATHLARGRMRLAAGRPADALESLDRFLEGDPDHAEGSMYRARALAGLGRGEDAVRSYSRSIEKASAPAPDIYLERADLLRRLGRGDEALRGLDEGIARLGPAAALDLRALDIETELERWDDALRRVERRLRAPGRAEEWQLRRAELLRRLGRGDEAAAACRAALASLEALPASRRDTPATADLERRLRALLPR